MYRSRMPVSVAGEIELAATDFSGHEHADWHGAHTMGVGTTVWVSERPREVEIVHRRPRLRLRVGSGIHEVTEVAAEEGAFELVIDGVSHRGWRYLLGHEAHIRYNGRTFIVPLADSRVTAEGTSAGHYQTRANMPGVVVAVHCEEGQSVKAGDRLVTIESMKLQTTLTAAHEAVVERVHVKPETVFERDTVLVTFASDRSERDWVQRVTP